MSVMIRRLAFTLLATIALLPRPCSASDQGAPSPGMLQEIQAGHGRNDWWYVTTDSARFLARIRTVDAQGLSGLKPKHASERVPERIAWSSIARIDQRYSKFLAKRIQGVLYGALIGGTVPFLIDQTNGSEYAAAGILSGAVLGGWLGGLHGDGIVREEQVYVSPALIAPRPEAPPDSVTSPDAAIAEACRLIRPSDLVRVRGDFGTFQGHVEHAGQDGLGGLRPQSSSGQLETIPGVVTWDRIRQVDLRGNNARAGARNGAIGLGVLGALAGQFANHIATGLDGESGGGTWIAIGAAAGVGAGALIGAAVGSAGASWKPIYVR